MRPGASLHLGETLPAVQIKTNMEDSVEIRKMCAKKLAVSRKLL